MARRRLIRLALIVPQRLAQREGAGLRLAWSMFWVIILQVNGVDGWARVLFTVLHAVVAAGAAYAVWDRRDSVRA